MRRRTLAICFYAVVGLLDCANADSLEERIMSDVNLMRTNRAARQRAFNFGNDEYWPGMKIFFREAQRETNLMLRTDLMGEVRRCAEHLRGKEGGSWCTNIEVGAMLIEDYGRCPTERGAEFLMRFISPIRLNAASNVIVNTTKMWTNDWDRGSRTMLLALMDCVSLKEISELTGDGRPVKENYGIPHLNWDSLRARHGDTNAEARILAIAQSTNIAYQTAPSQMYIGFAIARSRSEKCLRLAAESLRTEEYIVQDHWLAKGRETSRREIWMTAIFKAMRDESENLGIGLERLSFDTFVRDIDGKVIPGHIQSNLIMDLLEQWCTKRFGTKYSGPRKMVPFIKGD